MPDYKNLMLFVSDALRYDFGKEYMSDLPGTFVKGVAQGSYSPASFPTIVSGSLPAEHGVSMFESDGITLPTIFDLPDHDTGYFDHPDDPVVRLVGNPPIRNLRDMEEPFVYVERELATHTPYGINWRTAMGDGIEVGPSPGNPRDYPHYQGHSKEEWNDGHEYIQLMQEGNVDYIEDYKRGCEISLNRFIDHVDYLEENGLLDDTLVVYTADHGEVWAPYDDRPGKWIHNVNCPETINVPLLFYDRDLDIREPFLLKDIIRLWMPEWDRVKHGIEPDHGDVRYNHHEPHDNVEGRLKALGYI